MQQEHPIYYEDADSYDYAIRRGYAAVEADVWGDHAVVHLPGGKQATIEGSAFSLFGFDHNRPSSTAQGITRSLADNNIPAVCWRFRWMGGEACDWANIENESARLHAESVLWDEDRHQLVAALFAASDIQLAKAVVAGLMTNSDKVGKTWLRCYGPRVLLASAKGRYVRVSRSLVESNAAGNAQAVLHPRAGNPREFAGDFYVVAARGEDLTQKFRGRLDMALELPVKPEWASYLLYAGEDAGLVANLSSFGAAFSGLRVSRKAYGENSWESVISAGLREGAISI